MRRILTCLLVLTTLAITLPASAAKWALLVGVNDYDNPDITHLNYAVDDVEAVGRDLGSIAGFPPGNVIVMTSDDQGNARPTNVDVLKRLDLLSRRIQPGDTFVFYFSGHGFIREGDQHFLATVNADPTSIETLQITSLPMSLLREQMAKIRARNVVFIIDACRNDPESGKGGGDNLRTPAFTKDLTTVIDSSNGGQAGTALLFACGENERSYEEPEWKHGVFTHYLLEGMETRKAVDPRGNLTMSSLAEYVQAKVGAWSDDNDKEQHPDLEQHGAAQIVLCDHLANALPAPVPVVEPTPAPVVPVVITDIPPPTPSPVTPNNGGTGLSPIAPSTPDKAFDKSITDLLDASMNGFKSFRGSFATLESDAAGSWTLYGCEHDVPGFKSGMIRIHPFADGNYYDEGNYAEYESDKKWSSTDEADAVTAWRTASGQILAAVGGGWSSKVVRSEGSGEIDAVFTRDSVTQFIKLKLMKDRNSNFSLVLDVSDGVH